MANVTGVVIPAAVARRRTVRAEMLDDFGIEIGTSFGPLHGKIWRIGTMGYVCRKARTCCAAWRRWRPCSRRNDYPSPPGAGVDAAIALYAADDGDE